MAHFIKNYQYQIKRVLELQEKYDIINEFSKAISDYKNCMALTSWFFMFYKYFNFGCEKSNMYTYNLYFNVYYFQSSSY